MILHQAFGQKVCLLSCIIVCESRDPIVIENQLLRLDKARPSGCQAHCHRYRLPYHRMLCALFVVRLESGFRWTAPSSCLRPLTLTKTRPHNGTAQQRPFGTCGHFEAFRGNPGEVVTSKSEIPNIAHVRTFEGYFSDRVYRTYKLSDFFLCIFMLCMFLGDVLIYRMTAKRNVGSNTMKIITDSI